MRIRKKKWARNVIDTSRQIININKLDLDFDLNLNASKSDTKKFDPEKYFGNNNPVCVELGCGKGKFINQMAAECPDKNFIAIEKYFDIIAMGVRRANNSLSNLAFIMDDIKNLEKYFFDAKINSLYINFCDPWPKNKHAKRRLTHKNFLDIYKKLLAPGAGIYLKTDNQNLFEFSLNEFSDNGFRLKNIFFDLHNKKICDNNINMRIKTEYEEKFLGLGMPIFYCEAYLI